MPFIFPRQLARCKALGDSVQPVHVDLLVDVILSDVPVRVGGLPVFLPTVGTLVPRFLPALVPEMCQHVAFLTVRVATLRTDESLTAFVAHSFQLQILEKLLER